MPHDWLQRIVDFVLILIKLAHSESTLSDTLIFFCCCPFSLAILIVLFYSPHFNHIIYTRYDYPLPITAITSMPNRPPNSPETKNWVLSIRFCYWTNFVKPSPSSFASILYNFSTANKHDAFKGQYKENIHFSVQNNSTRIKIIYRTKITITSRYFQLNIVFRKHNPIFSKLLKILFLIQYALSPF